MSRAPKGGASAHGNPVPVPSSKESAWSSGEDKEVAGSSSAESVQTKSASSLDVDSAEEEEGGNRQGPHQKNCHSAHRGVMHYWGIAHGAGGGGGGGGGRHMVWKRFSAPHARMVCTAFPMAPCWVLFTLRGLHGY